ncbi:peptidase S45 [Halobacteriales archaeon QS_4_66_20]|nr:MAG: peptidase S45 [Halobacteriales archaeon QS_4_66_20]
MDRETTRRAVLGGIVGAGVAGGLLSPASQYLEQFAPLSGSVWGAARTSRQGVVESPYGPAQLRYDDEGVAGVSADAEPALYYAVGYAQGADRLFQMDLQRRLFRGQLSAVVGDVTLGSDRFHRQMAFAEAAEVTAEHVQESEIGPLLAAYRDGVNDAMDHEELPLECQLLGYEPDPWTVADSALIEKLIAWQLTGSFRTLRRALVREEFGAEMADQLFPARVDHDTPIIREGQGPERFGASLLPQAGGDGGSGNDGGGNGASSSVEPVGGPLLARLSRFEPPSELGSNSWVIGPEHADGDAPILSNDPHLSLQAPPTWYELQVDGPEHRARGVAFPGSPFVVIGENDHGAWGFTNAGADVIDFYRYDRDGETYRYGDERREFAVEEQEIEVDGGDDETVEVRKSVHGPVIEESGQEVGVAWTGHTATETTVALYRLSHSAGMADARAAIEQFDAPTQNFLYADRDGNTRYHMTGRVPIRTVDGEAVHGDQIFDGSAPEGEWAGFEPFGESTWEGFVPVPENPHVVNPEYLSTANQRIVDDDRLGYYLAASYADGYRGRRIAELLDDRVESEEPIDLDFLRTVGRDTYDGRAAEFVPDLVAAARDAEDADETLRTAADRLDEWNYRMDADSRAALVFDLWMAEFQDATFAEVFEESEVDDGFRPSPATIAALSEDSRWFGSSGRATLMRRALRDALAEIDDEGHEVYGDVNHTGHIGHPLGLDFLGYDAHPRGGTGWTVWNYGRGGPWGGSWEMQDDLDGDLLGLLPGGNSGHYFSTHYDDQIERWANGEYRTLSREIEGDLTTRFVEGDG